MYKIKEYETSTGTTKVKLAGKSLNEIFETIDKTGVSGVIILNGTHLARNTNKVKPVEIKGDKVVHEILVTKNNREIETIVTVEVPDCELFAPDNAKMVDMQAKAVKDSLTDFANTARESQLTEEEKVKAVKETLKSLQLQGVEISTIKEIVAEW